MAILPASEVDALEDRFISCGGSEWNWIGEGLPWSFSSDVNSYNKQSRKINNGFVGFHMEYLDSSKFSNPCSDNWEGISCNCSNYKPLKEHHEQVFYYYYDKANIGYYYDNSSYHNHSYIHKCTITKIYLMGYN